MKKINEFFSVFTKLNRILSKKQKIKGIKIIFLMIISSVFELVGIAIMSPFINALLMPENLMENKYIAWLAHILGMQSYIGFLTIMILGISVVYLIKNMILIYSRGMQMIYQCQVEEELSLAMLKSYLNKPYSFYIQTNSSVIRHGAIDDISYVFQILQTMCQLLAESITVFVIVVYIVYQDFFMAVGIMLAVGLTVAILTLLFKNILKHTGERYRIQDVERNKSIIQISQGVKDIFALQRKHYFYNRYKSIYDEYRKSKTINYVIQGCPERIIETIFIVSICIVVLFRIAQGVDAMTFVPKLGILAMAAYRLLPSINKFSNGINSIIFYSPSLNAAYENICAAKDELRENGEGEAESVQKLSFDKSISIRNVVWQYSVLERKILDNVSLEIKKGEAIAIIGESGSGKTTLADILLGLYKPMAGDILVDGREIYSDIKQWSHIISYVPQAVYLLDDTIRENIAFGYNDVDDNRIWNVLEQAQLKEFVKELPEGLDTVVGEAGVRFSGGQRQRIAIARALYSQPDILLLDEATAALDNETEAAVMEAIDSLKGKKTLIIIAHRLSTIKNCNKVYEVKNGNIIDVSENFS